MLTKQLIQGYETEGGGKAGRRQPSSPVRFSSCRLLSRGDGIVDLLDGDPPHEEGSVLSTGRLHVGSIVCLDLPRIGRRNARILWILSGQAGCRLLVPVTESELRASVADSRIMPRRLSGPIENPVVPRRLSGPVDGVKERPRNAIADTPIEIMRIPKGPTLLPAPSVGDGIDLVLILSLGLVVLTWIALYVLPF